MMCIVKKKNCNKYNKNYNKNYNKYTLAGKV